MENRSHCRTHVEVPVRFLGAGTVEATVLSFDVAPGGISICTETRLVVDERCALAFELPVPDRRRRINAWGRVIYVRSWDNGLRYGIQFLDMDARSRDCLQLFARMNL